MQLERWIVMTIVMVINHFHRSILVWVAKKNQKENMKKEKNICVVTTNGLPKNYQKGNQGNIKPDKKNIKTI